MTTPSVLTAAEVRRIDAQYKGVPTFAGWADAVIPAGLWSETLALLAERNATAPAGALDEMIEQAMRTAAVDTGAIEGLYDTDRGFTVSVAAMAAAWEAEITQEKGPEVASLVMAQRRAYDLALDAATTLTPISEAWIRRLHEVVCAEQDTYAVRTPQGPQLHELRKGTYKRHPNHVVKADGSVHAFAPVEATPEEMHRLVEELRSEAFVVAHPVVQAAYAHYALAAIHPFADGNGRTARVLASVFLLRATSLPLVVWADQKGTYLDALASTDGGDPQRFVDFVLDRAVDLQLELAERLATAGAPELDASLDRLGNPEGDRERVLFERLLVGIRAATERALDDASLPPDIARRVFLHRANRSQLPSGFRLVRSPRAVTFSLARSAENGSGSVKTALDVLISDEPEPTFAFRLDASRYTESIDLRIQDVHPLITPAAQRRIGIWAERLIRLALAELADQTEQ